MQLTREQSTAAMEAATLARNLVSGYYTLRAALTVASMHGVPEPHRSARARPNPSLQSTGELTRRNGARHEYSIEYYLARLQDSPEAGDAIERSWLASAILQLGELLARRSYFDRAPELELFRHLRNAVAHGNLFNIPATANLDAKPAHNRRMQREHRGCSSLSISRELNGKAALFEFMDRADVLDLIVWIGFYLETLAKSSLAALNTQPPHSGDQTDA